MNGFAVPCSPSIITPSGGCSNCRVTAFPGEYPASVLGMSSHDYMRASFDPDVVGPPGTCWLFTILDVDVASHPDAIPGLWWIQPILGLGFYVWRVPVRWVRANVTGSMPAGESFCHALSINAGSDTSWVDSTALHNIALTVAAAFDAFMVALEGKFTSQIVYREVAASLLQQTTVGGDIDTILTSEFAPINGSDGRGGVSGSAQLPNEVSMAVSWETGVRGRRGRGRTYLPAMTSDSLADWGGWKTADCELVADYCAETLIPALNGGGDTWQLAVRSGKDLALYNVTGCRVANVPDSQRRRRRSIVPAFFEGS